jgi:hypothetical protein
VNRYTYDVYEPEDFQELLDFWVRTKEIYYPVFVQWHDSENENAHSATFWLETDLYRARITIGKREAEEVYAVFAQQLQGRHRFIECHVYANDEES